VEFIEEKKLKSDGFTPKPSFRAMLEPDSNFPKAV
jgi:hypothetical protein